MLLDFTFFLAFFFLKQKQTKKKIHVFLEESVLRY